jgi:MSHA biogenesis protein MshK
VSKRLLAGCLALTAATAGGALAADVLDDPMRPPHLTAVEAARPAAKPAGYTLSSVVIGADRRVAVVNGRTVTVGDRVGAATVIDIQPSTVALARGGDRFVISLVALDVKKIAKKPKQ